MCMYVYSGYVIHPGLTSGWKCVMTDQLRTLAGRGMQDIKLKTWNYKTLLCMTAKGKLGCSCKLMRAGWRSKHWIRLSTSRCEQTLCICLRSQKLLANFNKIVTRLTSFAFQTQHTALSCCRTNSSRNFRSFFSRPAFSANPVRPW